MSVADHRRHLDLDLDLDLSHPASPPVADVEALIDLEYHALMGVPNGDEPPHVRSFVRDVVDPAPEADPDRGGRLDRPEPAM